MIKGLYETHLYVENLERSIEFYTKVLGLKQCRFEEERRTAFFWIGKDKQAMLGLWEKPKKEIDLRHFAFECDPEWVVNESVNFLKSHDLNYWNFLQDDNERPMVFVGCQQSLYISVTQTDILSNSLESYPEKPKGMMKSKLLLMSNGFK